MTLEVHIVCRFLNVALILIFSPVSRVCLQTYKVHVIFDLSVYINMTPRPEVIIYGSRKKIALCGNRNRYTWRGSQLPSQRVNRAVAYLLQTKQ